MLRVSSETAVVIFICVVGSKPISRARRRTRSRTFTMSASRRTYMSPSRVVLMPCIGVSSLKLQVQSSKPACAVDESIAVLTLRLRVLTLNLQLGTLNLSINENCRVVGVARVVAQQYARKHLGAFGGEAGV